MAYSIVVTESAERDLDAILEYITHELCNADAAVSFANAVEEKYTVLEENPYAYEASRNELLKRRGYHRIVIDNYVLMYLVDEGERAVKIARVFYGRQDYEKYL